jgi:hypothetical protein
MWRLGCASFTIKFNRLFDLNLRYVWYDKKIEERKKIVKIGE